MKMNKKVFAIVATALLTMTLVYGAITWWFTSQTLPFHISVYGITGMAWQLSLTPGAAFDNYVNKVNASSMLGEQSFGLSIFFENFYNVTQRLDVTVPSDIQGTLEVYAYEAFVALWKESKHDMGSGQDYTINHVTFMTDAGTVVADWTYNTLISSGSSTAISDPTIFRNITSCVNVNGLNTDGYVKLTTSEKSRIQYTTPPLRTEGYVPTLADCNTVVIFITSFTEYVHPGEFDCTLAVKMGTDR